MILFIDTTNTLELFIKLLEILIWPVLFVFVLVFFKKHFVSAMSRLGSINASATGVTMTFDNKMETAKKLLKTIQPKSISKSSSGIQVKNESYEALLKIKAATISKLKAIASKNGVATDNKTSTVLCSELEEAGIITIQKAKVFDSILDIASAADESFNASHLKVIDELFKVINA